MKNCAIALMSGSLKGIFVHGVLTAFEKAGMRADAYGTCSASTMPGAYAAIGKMEQFPMSYWTNYRAILDREGTSMSNVFLEGNAGSMPLIKEHLFDPKAARMMVSCSYVHNPEGAAVTQGLKASRLGRKLLLDGAKKNGSWKDENLEFHLFDSQGEITDLQITPENVEDVFYASTRMMHAWHIPAEVNGKPYVDGTYTTQCPAVPMAEMGYKEVIAVLTEPEIPGLDYFSETKIPDVHQGTSIQFVKPEVNLKDFGVDFTVATEEGLLKAFEHGVEQGNAFLKIYRQK